jgi:hypothetical protein
LLIDFTLIRRTLLYSVRYWNEVTSSPNSDVVSYAFIRKLQDHIINIVLYSSVNGKSRSPYTARFFHKVAYTRHDVFSFVEQTDFTYTDYRISDGKGSGRQSQWPRGLRHELSSFARKLGSWVRIPLKVWMSVRVYFVLVLLFVYVAALRRAG